MQPSDILMAILLIGAVGSVVFTVLFFFVMSFFVECPECRKSVSRRMAYCGHCGESVKCGAGQTAVPQKQNVPPHLQASEDKDDELTSLYQTIRRLPPDTRTRLNQQLRGSVIASKSKG